MKRAALACGLWLLLASSSLADWRDAVCRISHPQGQGLAVGSGCVFGADADSFRILTNGHVVAGSGGRVRVEFFPNGKRLAAVDGRVVWQHFTNHMQGYARDIAVVRVDRAQLGDFTPPVIPLAASGVAPKPGSELVTHGCRNGNEPTTFEPVVRGTSGSVFDFSPEAAGGRSGSPIVDPATGKIVGLIAWGSGGGGWGTAITVDEIRAGFAGLQPARTLNAPRVTRQVLRLPPTGDGFSPLVPIERLPAIPVQEEPPCRDCPPGGGHGDDMGGEQFPPYDGPGSGEDPNEPPDDPEQTEEEEEPRIPIPRPLPPGVGPVAPDAEAPAEQPPPQTETQPVAPTKPRPQPTKPPAADDCDLCPPNHNHQPAPQAAAGGNWQSISVPIPKLGDAAYGAILGGGAALGLPWFARVIMAKLGRRALNKTQDAVHSQLRRRVHELEEHIRSHNGDDIELADPPAVVERRKLKIQRVPTTDHEYEKLKEAIGKVVDYNPATAPIAEQIFSVYEQLIGGYAGNRAKLRAGDPAAVRMGWRDEQAA